MLKNEESQKIVPQYRASATTTMPIRIPFSVPMWFNAHGFRAEDGTLFEQSLEELRLHLENVQARRMRELSRELRICRGTAWVKTALKFNLETLKCFVKLYIVGILGIGLLSSPAPVEATEIPQLISYAGELSDSQGMSMPTGDYTLSFSIYDHPTHPPCQKENESDCAKRVWGPQVFDGKSGLGHGAQVPVVKGFFNAMLGPYDTAGRGIVRAFTSADRFVEVAVENGEPNLPRHQVLSAPYSLRSFSEIPVGGITMFYGKGDELPENWKICDGQIVYDPDSPYHDQYLPDLTGRFVRGATNDRDVKRVGGRDVVLTTHIYEAVVAISFSDRERDGVYALVKDRSDRYDDFRPTKIYNNSYNENRPRFMSMHYIIRIK